MRHADRLARASAGVLDAGIVLTRIDRRRRSHPRVVHLLDRSQAGRALLYLSVVNLAEVLEHGREYSQATGLDLTTLVTGFGVRLHLPDAATARAAAALATSPDLSLADRFAAATARVLRARLHTTDPVLARAMRRESIPVSEY
jgi:predicted nucleic acid-binding protein